MYINLYALYVLIQDQWQQIQCTYGLVMIDDTIHYLESLVMVERPKHTV